MITQTLGALEETAEFIRLAISKTIAMQTALESYFTVRIGPQQIAEIRESTCKDMPLDPEKATMDQVCCGLVDALEKSIEIQLELASALSTLKGRPTHEAGHREPNARAA